MKIFDIGGAGFIGFVVIRHIILNTQDNQVDIYKRTYAGNLENFSEVSNSKRYAFEQVNICNRTGLDRVFDELQPDAILHQAAESHVDRSIDHSAAFIESNIVGTYTLLEVARYYWQRLKIACLEEIDFNNGRKSKINLNEQGSVFSKNNYGQYLLRLVGQAE